MTVLVTGATGNQGGAVLRHLLQRGAKVRALTRNPASAKAQALAAQGVEVVAGDLTRSDSLDAALQGVDALFSVQDFYAPGGGLAGEIRQGRNLIAAAQRQAVGFVLQSSMGAADQPGGPSHFLSKATLERDLAFSGLAHAVIGTVWFLDNLLNPAMKPGMIFPVLAGSLHAETRFPMLSVDDLGFVAAEVLLNPSRFAGQKLNLAGDLLNVNEMKARYRAVTGRRPKGWALPAALFRRMVPEFAAQLAWHNRVNFNFGSETLRALRPDATDFAAFLQRHAIAGL